MKKREQEYRKKLPLLSGPSKMTYVYNGIRVKWSRIKWFTRSICTLLYINFDGLYIIMNSPYRSLCTKFIIYAIILYGYQIVRRSFFMAPKIPFGAPLGDLQTMASCFTTNLALYTRFWLSPLQFRFVLPIAFQFAIHLSRITA